MHASAPFKQGLLVRNLAYFGVVLTLGCSATDPGVENLIRADFRDSGFVSDGSRPTMDGTMGGDSSPPTDGAVDAGPPNAFTGASAFVSQKPATSARQAHMNKMVGVTPGKGTACMGCHANNNAPFLFAGTVFTDVAGTMAAVDYEVRVRDTNGQGYTAHSDDNGNFWFQKGMASFTMAKCGARSASQTALMDASISSGDCNGSACHGGGAGAIHVP